MGLKPHKYGRRYLESPWWRELRGRYVAEPSAPHCCAVCATPRYELHHRTYERCPYQEQLTDLIALCRQHHERLHRAYETHLRLHPEDSLWAFSDAWVIVQRRRFYKTAPLPSLALYGLDRAGDPVAGRNGRSGGGADPPLEGLS